ncbi:MAG: saccharopine dehydrogenase NADP-binding domain-containing protein, partial [Eubacteriales bacterium]|nr:saccharopine dehydrogenase NADP-binding domain-containing protein [Eubacteriales bacterium]
MGKALIIGCGGVAGVAIHKCVQNHEVFSEIMIASRTVEKCETLKAQLSGRGTVIHTARVDADDVGQLVRLIESFKPEVVLHLGLPYQDLTIMEACLKAGVHYIDTANYAPMDTATFEYKRQ